MQQKNQAPIIAGVVFLVIGGVLITIGWDKAASWDCVQCQFPYLLSASIPGIALTIVGLTVLVLAMVRKDAEEREAQLERLTASINQLATLVGPTDPYDVAVTGEYRPRPRVSSNGASNDAGDATAEIVKPGDFEKGK